MEGEEITITCGCGCQQKMWLYVQGAERTRYLEQLEQADCTACHGQPVEKATRAAVRAGGPLRGSERQVPWATDIRRTALYGVYDLIDSQKRLAAKHSQEVEDLDVLERAVRELATHTEARFWIDGRTRSPREWLVDAAYRILAQDKAGPPRITATQAHAAGPRSADLRGQ